MDPNPLHGQALYAMSPERVNRQSYENNPINISPTPRSHASRDSSVAERAAKFDTLAFQGKALERKVNDAALKRAVLGREEAESEMRKYREEARALRKENDELKSEGKLLKLEERYQALKDTYSRAKDHNKSLEKTLSEENRRLRKDAFKASSKKVELQEALNAARANQKAAEADYNAERERLKEREQEAFECRFQLVGVQQQLAEMIEKVKLVEQERDALRTIAKNEEIARIAAEGMLPLPASKADDEFASPRRASSQLAPITILSSAASEEEIESLRYHLKIERKRAERAFDQVEYMETECRFRRCSCRLTEISEKGNESTVHIAAVASEESVIKVLKDEDQDFDLYSIAPHPESRKPVFIPEEGTFRMEDTSVPQSSPWISPAKAHGSQTVNLPIIPKYRLEATTNIIHARTPSCEPPSFAKVHDINTSLLSLVERASNTEDDSTIHDGEEHPAPTPTSLAAKDTNSNPSKSPRNIESKAFRTHQKTMSNSAKREYPRAPSRQENISHSPQNQHDEEADHPRASSSQERPKKHIISPSQPIRTFHTISTTTRVPISDPDATPKGSHPLGPRPAPTSLAQSTDHAAFPPQTQSNATFDTTNSALSPTMTREQALAMIRERRGRARSLAQGTMTPRKQMVSGLGERRDISAPGGTARNAMSGARSVSRGRLGGRT